MSKENCYGKTSMNKKRLKAMKMFMKSKGK